MGIHVKMITGDQLLIGKETAKQLGMGQNMFTTEELVKAKQGFGLVGGHASVEDLVEEVFEIGFKWIEFCLSFFNRNPFVIFSMYYVYTKLELF